eukprot:gene27566-8815_t
MEMEQSRMEEERVRVELLLQEKSGSDHVAPFAPTFIPPADSWAAPFIMEGVNARVVHLSNALAKESYGSDF